MQIFPRFSLRTGLLSLTAVALLAVSLRAATLGEPWAIGAGIGVLSIPALLLLHAAFYAVARLLGRRPSTSPIGDCATGPASEGRAA